MKLKELRNTRPPKTLKKYKKEEYQVIWIRDYWDAPITGMLSIDEQYFWFELIKENWTQDDWFRRYAIVQLSDEQLEKEWQVHEDFQRYVGIHWDVQFTKPAPAFEENQQDVFYETHLAYINTERFEDNEVIGWFEN